MQGNQTSKSNDYTGDIITKILQNYAQFSGNAIKPPGYKIEQHQYWDPDYYHTIGILGAIGTTGADALRMMYGQRKPKEYRNIEQIKMNRAAEEGLKLSRNLAAGMQQQAEAISNKMGNKALDAVMSRNANTGMGSNSAAAAVAEFAKDLAYSNLSMDAYNRAASMSKLGYDTYAAQMGQSSELTQNLVPGETKRITMLETIGKLPSILMQGLNTQAEATTKKSYKYDLRKSTDR